MYVGNECLSFLKHRIQRYYRVQDRHFLRFVFFYKTSQNTYNITKNTYLQELSPTNQYKRLIISCLAYRETLITNFVTYLTFRTQRNIDPD